MNLDNLTSIFSRLFFFGAFLLLTLALSEAAVRLAGFTILRGTYSSGRLLELAAVLLVFVIALLLRQLREALVK